MISLPARINYIIYWNAIGFNLKAEGSKKRCLAQVPCPVPESMCSVHTDDSLRIDCHLPLSVNMSGARNSRYSWKDQLQWRFPAVGLSYICLIEDRLFPGAANHKHRLCGALGLKHPWGKIRGFSAPTPFCSMRSRWLTICHVKKFSDRYTSKQRITIIQTRGYECMSQHLCAPRIQHRLQFGNISQMIECWSDNRIKVQIKGKLRVHDSTQVFHSSRR